jgi:L-alanine-DL-glutamate epimerase-like enolase superfamily enzyme/predicted dehydrogenase
VTSTRYALIGTGSRALLYLDALTGTFADRAELVAWSDTNPGRLDFYTSYLADRDLAGVARFAPDDLSAAVRRHRVDRVVVTTPDATHAGYVAAALDAGADVIVEKPLTIDADGVRTIAAAVQRSGGDVTVTFNYRYAPRNEALKAVIRDGLIGDVTSVHFEWLLDTAHGADYFRRWHRDKRRSGGLLVHKSSHHFDLVNWWLAATPTRVFASGGLRFYGAANARSRGLGARPPRGSVDSPLRDAFSLDLRGDPLLKGLYLDQEHHDGYLRDRDVFDDGITIEDNLSLVVDYSTGASMSYTLSAHGPWEGYTVAVNGTAGRAELTVVERGALLADAAGTVVTDPSAFDGIVGDDETRPVGHRLLVQRHFEVARELPIVERPGGHGGADAEMLRDVLGGERREDPLGRAASWRDGVRSIAVGLAGNESLATGRAVSIDELGLDHSLRSPATQAAVGRSLAGARSLARLQGSPATQSAIATVDVRRRQVPLVRPWGPDVTTVTVIGVDVHDSDGVTGHGFSWTPTIGGAAVEALLVADIGPWAIGRPATPELWDAAWEHLHEAGGGGITTIALAGLDLALWDLRCRREGVGLDELLGRRHESQPAYGSGINRHYPLDELVAQACRWRDAGFTAVKIKVGLPDVDDDVARVRAVRDAIGPDIGLMIDANQRWDLPAATAAVEHLAEFDLAWLEEPLRSDDTAGYVELRRRTSMPIALGENVHHRYRFAELIDGGACDVVQPNVVRVGGITPFLRIAEVARQRGASLAPHLLVDLSARLAVTLPETTWVEDVEDAGFERLGALSTPSGVEIRDGRACVAPVVGIGVELAAR